MEKQLVPIDILGRADKVLFVNHLAIGDFLYLQTYFRAFHEQYPHSRIHVWVDELRRTWKWWKWEGLRRYSLYDWLHECPFIEQVYDKTYSPMALMRSIKAARAEQYPVVVSLAVAWPHRYALLSRLLGGRRAFVAGLSPLRTWRSKLRVVARMMYCALDASCPVKPEGLEPGYHATDLYAAFFLAFFGMVTPVIERRPFVDIPRGWRTHAKRTLLKWGVTNVTGAVTGTSRTVFINIFAKYKNRCWPVGAVFELIAMLRTQDYFAQALFILNVVPGELESMQRMLREHRTNNVILFAADEHFFQLPAIIELCDLVISVETAVMHIAAALKVPVIALMRTTNPEWVPWDEEYYRVVMAARRTDWVRNIPPIQVSHVVSAFVLEVERRTQA